MAPGRRNSAPADPTENDPAYYEVEVEGPVYRAGDKIPCRITDEQSWLTKEQLERLVPTIRAGGPVLWEHRTDIGHAGRVVRAWLEGDVLHATARLFAPVTWAPAADLRRRIRAGDTRCFSIGWDVVNGAPRFVELSVCDKGFFDIARMTRVRASSGDAASSAPSPAAFVSLPSPHLFAVREKCVPCAPGWGALGAAVLHMRATNRDHGAGLQHASLRATMQSSSTTTTTSSAAQQEAAHSDAPPAGGDAAVGVGPTDDEAVRVLRAAVTGKGASPHLMKIEERLQRLEQLEKDEAKRLEEEARAKAASAQVRAAEIRGGPIRVEVDRFFDKVYAVHAAPCVQLRASGDQGQLDSHLKDAKSAYIENLIDTMNAHEGVQPLLPFVQYLAEDAQCMRASLAAANEETSLTERLVNLGAEPGKKRRREDDDVGVTVRATKKARPDEGSEGQPTSLLVRELRDFFKSSPRTGVNAPIPDEVLKLGTWTARLAQAAPA